MKIDASDTQALQPARDWAHAALYVLIAVAAVCYLAGLPAQAHARSRAK